MGVFLLLEILSRSDSVLAVKRARSKAYCFSKAFRLSASSFSFMRKENRTKRKRNPEKLAFGFPV
jgi:hypothetical protein